VKVVAWVAAVVVAVVAAVLVGTQLHEVAATTTTPAATPPKPADPGDPLRITIPAIDVDAALVPVGL
jgi:hypothetical protein